MVGIIITIQIGNLINKIFIGYISFIVKILNHYFNVNKISEFDFHSLFAV